ncbi:helix-turn-helix domain-containing protein [Alkalinema pantanalense CENA528]|uniref:helix-turn-helix domain-containing protein n=1 Tax=Alkalinema pantanalense TaxID=1620705 RepID=UPI003D6DF97B
MLAQDSAFQSLHNTMPGADAADQCRQIIAQVETALCRSDVYRQALDQLQQLAVENGTSTQFMLKSVIRETIRLAVRCVTHPGEAIALLSPEASQTSSAETTDEMDCTAVQLDVQPEIKPASKHKVEGTGETQKPASLTRTELEAQEDAATFKAIAQVLQTKPDTLAVFHPKPRERKLTPAEQAQKAADERAVRLRRLCARIKHERQSRGFSLAQIHARTFIPLYHLQAIEQCNIEHLPEDIYLRGFVRRLEQTFGLALGSLTDGFPNPQPAQAVPTWYHSQTEANPKKGNGLSVHPLHLYLTYGAVMAGGVFWLSQQAAPKANVAPIQIDESFPQQSAEPIQSKSDTKAAKMKAPISQQVAAPEILR